MLNAALARVGFWPELLKPPGPFQEKLLPMLVVPTRFKGEASQTGLLLDALADGVWFTRIETCSEEAVQGEFVMVHWNTYVPAVVIPVTVVVGEPGLVITGVIGPLMKLQLSVPTLAALAAMVVEPGLVQMV